MVNGGGDHPGHIRHRETNPRRAVRLWWQQLQLHLSQEARALAICGLAQDIIALILAGSVAVICLRLSRYGSINVPPTSGPAHSSRVETTPAYSKRFYLHSPGGKAIDLSQTREPRSGERRQQRKGKTAATATGPGLDQTTSQSARRAKSDRSTTVKAPFSAGADASPQPRDEDVCRRISRAPAMSVAS